MINKNPETRWGQINILTYWQDDILIDVILNFDEINPIVNKRNTSDCSQMRKSWLIIVIFVNNLSKMTMIVFVLAL